MKNSQKGSVALIIIIVLAIVAVGGFYYYSQKSAQPKSAENSTQATITDQMAGWKTYTNSQYGIELKYPTTWNIVKNPGDPSAIIELLDSEYPGKPDTDAPANIFVVSTMTDSEVKNISSGKLQENAGWSTTDFAGVPYKVVYFPSKDLKVVITVVNETSKAVADQILSTFKYSKTTLPNESTGDALINFERYTNTQTGISFQYPSKFNSNFAALNNDPKVIVTSNKTNIDANGCYSLQTGKGEAGKESQVTIHNIQFCLSQGGDVGAGQLYQDYYYTTFKNGNYITVGYTIHTPNGCGVYEGTSQYDSCEAFFKNYDTFVLQPIQQSVATLKFAN